MNMENKYRKGFRISGLVTLISFFLTLLFFFLFGISDKDSQQARLDAFAMLTLLFAGVFFVSMIVFIVFFALKGTEARRMRKLIEEGKRCAAENSEEVICPHCGKANRSSDRFCSSCGKEIGGEDESKLLFTYEDAKPLRYGTYLKGYYYSGTTPFYVFLVCAFALLAFTLYFVLAKPDFELASMLRNCSIVLTVLFFALFLLCFVLMPLLMSKKNKTARQTVQFYDDKIAVMTNINSVEGIQNTSSFVRTEYSYIASKKAKKDKEAYYFFFLNDKGAKVVLMIGYQNRPQFTKEMQDFLDEKVRLINKKRTSKL